MTAFPEAARRALYAKRLMDHQGVTRKPKPRHCRRCGVAVIAAIDDLGLTTAAWPTPTTAKGELDALLAGARTWMRIGERMVNRYHGNIAWPSYSADRVDVHVEHQCGKPPPPSNPKRMKPTRKKDDNAPPPF